MARQLATPLLDVDSPLDAHAKQIVQTLFDKDIARLRALPEESPLNPERRRRVEITRPEIMGQPARLVATLEAGASALRSTAQDLARNPPSRIYLSGCGDSYAVMVGMRLLLEETFGVACEPMQALDFAYYFHRPVDSKTLIISLSSSGETPRTVEAHLMAKALGARTLAISNTPQSTLMRESDHKLVVIAERKGWPTQASTAAMGLLAALCIEVRKLSGADRARTTLLAATLDALPDQIGKVIAACEAPIDAIAAQNVSRPNYLFSGGGPSFASAFFGAAKIKECTPNHALAIPLEEYHHYRSQKRGDPLFLIAPDGYSVNRARDTMEDGLLAGGAVYVIASEGNDMFESASVVLRLPALPEAMAAILYTVPLQLFAYAVAMKQFAAAEQEGR